MYTGSAAAILFRHVHVRGYRHGDSMRVSYVSALANRFVDTSGDERCWFSVIVRDTRVADVVKVPQPHTGGRTRGTMVRIIVRGAGDPRRRRCRS